MSRMRVRIGWQLSDSWINFDIVNKFVKNLVQNDTAFAESNQHDG